MLALRRGDVGASFRRPFVTPAVRKYLLFSIVAVISLALDQWTKVLARTHLKPRGSFNPKVIIDGLFDLRYAENPGVAFSMLQNMPGWALALVAVVAFVLVVAHLRKHVPSDATLEHIALGMVGGGALGNLLDRLLYGRVTDFIVWKAKWGGEMHEWPAFNIADAALCVGVVLIGIDAFRRWRAQPPEPASS
jgi:signal peptidase II